MRLVILDLDQTILDTLPRFHSVFNEVLEEVGGRPLPWGDFLGLYSADDLDSAIPGGVDPAFFWREFASRYSSRRHPGDAPIAGAREAIASLASMGISLAVATGRRCDPEEVRGELEEFGLADGISAFYSLGQLEPESGIWDRDRLISAALADFGVPPREAAFVGDYWVDVRSAKRAGVTAIAVLTGLEPEERLRAAGADHIIGGIWELPDLIRELAGRPPRT